MCLPSSPKVYNFNQFKIWKFENLNEKKCEFNWIIQYQKKSLKKYVWSICFSAEASCPSPHILGGTEKGTQGMWSLKQGNGQKLTWFASI